jgi:MYXO-CTERM domain-containing protein
VLSKIEIADIAVTNSELLREEPAKLAESLKELIGGLVGQALGSSIPAIDINDLLSGINLPLSIPETEPDKGSPGLRKLTKGSDDFLGIFGTLGDGMASPKAPPPNAPDAPHASAKIIQKEVDPSGVRLPTMTPSNAPVVRLEMAAAADGGARPIERAYRVDNGLWHPFTRESVVTVDDPWLRLQGRHTIEVRSRFAGDAMSLDPKPASVEVLIDVEPPSIAVRQAPGEEVAIAVRDFVSSEGKTLVRTRLDKGAWSAWAKASSDEVLVDVEGAAAIEVEAQDEEGNIATAAQAIIRGGAAASDAGCGCVAAGDDAKAGSWAALFGAAIAAVARARSRRRRDRA